MLTFRAPSAGRIAEFRAAQQNQPLTYPVVGMTRGEVPAGFRRDHLRERLGEGQAVFERAVSALRSWVMFRQGWVELHSDGQPPAIGQVVAIVPRIGPTWWANACRVVYLVDEDEPLRRVGFAYGTLPDHAECGEERFCIEMSPDGGVWYDLFAYSRPRHWLARLGKPFARAQQRRFAKGSAAAMQRAVAGHE